MEVNYLAILIIAGIAAAAFIAGTMYQNLLSRLAALENAQKSRNPYRTNEGLEDAMAIVHDAAWQARETLDYVDCRMAQVDRVLQTIRSEPDKYNSDAPNGKKVRK